MEERWHRRWHRDGHRYLPWCKRFVPEQAGCLQWRAVLRCPRDKWARAFLAQRRHADWHVQARRYGGYRSAGGEPDALLSCWRCEWYGAMEERRHSGWNCAGQRYQPWPEWEQLLPQ